MTPQTYFWLIVLAGFAALLSFQFTPRPEANFNFSTGLVQCGVAGVSTTCGSVVDKEHMWSPLDTGKR